MLAAVMALHPDELRADLQHYYGIDLDDAMAGRHSAAHVAALVACLPSDCHVLRAESPDAIWTLDSVLLASILNSLQGLIWGMSDKAKRGDRPKPIGPSYLTDRPRHKLPAQVMPIDELDRKIETYRRKAASRGRR